MNTRQMTILTCLLLGASACAEKTILADISPDQAKIELDRLGTAIDNWVARKREVPTSLQALVDTKHLKAEHLVDPWGTPYRLDDEGTVCSAGPDKAAGTPDDICRAR